MVAPSARDWRRVLGALGLAITLAVLSFDLVKLFDTAAIAFGYPYDLDYGEGIVWQQMDNIRAGHGYGPLGVFPAIVYHYPPVYHVVVAALIDASGLDPLVAGRGVSFAATLAVMAMTGWLVAAACPGKDRRTIWIGALTGGIAAGISPTVLTWSSLMRVDMLATALASAGLCWTVSEMRRPTRLPWGAFAFALAVYTKQTAVIAPAAALLTLLVVRRRSAWRLLIVCAALGIAALVALMMATHGEFLRHVVTYNVNRFDPGRWQLVLSVLASQAITVAIGAIMAWTILAHRFRDRRAKPVAKPGADAALLFGVYFVLRVLTIPLMLKSGASDNYLIDLFMIAAVLLGVATVDVAAALLGDPTWPRVAITLLVLIGLPIQAARLGDTDAAARDPAFRALNDAMAARIRAEPRPVVSDYMVLLKRGDHPVLWEPAIAAELGAAGRYDEAGFIRIIRSHRIGFFLVQGEGRAGQHGEHYNPAVDAAITAAYPRVERSDGMVLHLPPAGAATN